MKIKHLLSGRDPIHILEEEKMQGELHKIKKVA